MLVEDIPDLVELFQSVGQGDSSWTCQKSLLLFRAAVTARYTLYSHLSQYKVSWTSQREIESNGTEPTVQGFTLEESAIFVAILGAYWEGGGKFGA